MRLHKDWLVRVFALVFCIGIAAGPSGVLSIRPDFLSLSRIAEGLPSFSFAMQPDRPSALSAEVPRTADSDGRMPSGHRWAAPVNTQEAMQDTTRLACAAGEFHRKITILGSTGSIGTQALDIVAACPKHFTVVGLAAGSNVELLANQTALFRPQIVAIRDASKLPELRTALESKLGARQLPILVGGEEGVSECAAYGDSEVVVTGIVGVAGLLPTIAAIRAGKHIALANKETLVAGAPVILPLLEQYGVRVLPADSEHSAIFQCLQGVPPGGLGRLILTASGGAFREWSKADLHRATLQDALKHPNWSMGAKVTIDSATLMNKGLEVLEAHFLFGVPLDSIEVLVHPQSIVHSLVETVDTSLIAQLGLPDMRLPILYAMSWPHRVKMLYKRLHLADLKQLTFQEPDTEKYPCLQLAYEAGRAGGTMPAVMNAANERAVEMFREGRIGFTEIPEVIRDVMTAHKAHVKTDDVTLQDILDADAWARHHATEVALVRAAMED